MKSSLRFTNTQRVLLVVAFFALTLGFQNCAQVSFLSSPFESAAKSGNGGVYGGKLVGTFYRFAPDFTCEQKEAPSAVLDVGETGAELTENKSLLCGASKQQLDLSLIDSSIYQNEIAGYLEGIFEGQSKVPLKIPSNLVEVWCKDRNDEQGIETITHFDRVQNLAVNRIYYSEQSPSGDYVPHEIPDATVARVIGQNTVIVKDALGFELTVHRDQPAAKTGLFKAELKANIGGQTVMRDTSCRLGGSVDPTVWPSKQIVDLNVLDFALSADKSSLAFSSDTATGNANMYYSTSTGAALKQISPDQLSPGIQDFWFTPDSKNVIYRGSQRKALVPEIFKVNFDGSGNQHLGGDLVDDYQTDPQGRRTPVMFTNTGAMIYKDGAGNQKSVSALNLNVVSFSGGTPLKINAPYNDSFGVYGYNYSPQLNKVVYVEGMPTTPDFYSVDLDGSNLLKITPAISPTTSLLWYDQLALSAGGRYVVLQGIEHAGSLHGKHIAVALDGSGSVPIPELWEWSFSNATETFAFLISQVYTDPSGRILPYDTSTRLMNFKTGSLVRLPPLKNAFFTKDSRNLVGARVRDDGQLQSLIYSTANGTQTELCADVSGSLMKILEYENNQFAIVSYAKDSRILTVHLRNSAGTCTKVNSVVATREKLDSIKAISMSPDRQKLLVHMEVSQFSGTFQIAGVGNQVFYIPLNGKPGLLVNTPVTATAGIVEATFLNDSQAVLYRGDQVRTGKQNVFLWKAPAN